MEGAVEEKAVSEVVLHLRPKSKLPLALGCRIPEQYQQILVDQAEKKHGEICMCEEEYVACVYCTYVCMYVCMEME